jgi:AcrR family transcriptional regulator
MPGEKASEELRRTQILRAAFAIAARDGLDGLTIRHVAAKAALSAGLVLFHFRSRAQLILALLDWVLATTTVLHITEDIAAIEAPLDRLKTLLQREMHRLSSEPARMRVFFEFWVRGIRDREIRRKMQAELDRYREAFRPITVEVLQTEPSRFAHVSAEGLAAVAVSFIKGCAVQSMIDPKHFDIEQYLAAVQGLVGHPAAESM